MYEDIESIGVNFKEFATVTAYITAQFNRAFFALYENRKKVIRRFTKCDTFSDEDAALLLSECESRPVKHVKPQPEEDTSTYEQLADIANRLHIFTSSITADDLLRFRNATPGKPLYATNISIAVFFLSMLALHDFLPHNWKSKIANEGLLISARTGKVQKPKYLRNVSSLNNVSLYMDFIPTSKQSMSLNVREEIAISVRNVKLSVNKT